MKKTYQIPQVQIADICKNDILTGSSERTFGLLGDEPNVVQSKEYYSFGKMNW